jgi:hypothetical protein
MITKMNFKTAYVVGPTMQAVLLALHTKRVLTMQMANRVCWECVAYRGNYWKHRTVARYDHVTITARGTTEAGDWNRSIHGHRILLSNFNH